MTQQETVIKRPLLQDQARVERLRSIWVDTPLTADQVFWMRIEAGLEWLRWHTRHDTDGGVWYATLRDSAMYWQWVCTIWDLTDLQILSDQARKAMRLDASDYYRLQEERLCQCRPSSGLIKLIKQYHATNLHNHAQEEGTITHHAGRATGSVPATQRTE